MAAAVAPSPDKPCVRRMVAWKPARPTRPRWEVSVELNMSVSKNLAVAKQHEIRQLEKQVAQGFAGINSVRVCLHVADRPKARLDMVIDTKAIQPGTVGRVVDYFNNLLGIDLLDKSMLAGTPWAHDTDRPDGDMRSVKAIRWRGTDSSFQKLSHCCVHRGSGNNYCKCSLSLRHYRHDGSVVTRARAVDDTTRHGRLVDTNH